MAPGMFDLVNFVIYRKDITERESRNMADERFALDEPFVIGHRYCMPRVLVHNSPSLPTRQRVPRKSLSAMMERLLSTWVAKLPSAPCNYLVSSA